MKNKILFLFIGLFSLCAFAQDPYVVPSGRKDQVTKVKGGMAFDSLCIVPVRKTSENLYHQIDSIGRLQVDSETKKLMYHNGTQWVEAGAGGGGSQDLQQTVDYGKVGIVNPDGENPLRLGMWQYDNIGSYFNGIEVYPGNTNIKGGSEGIVGTITVDGSIRLEAASPYGVDIFGDRLTFNGVDVPTESKLFGVQDTISVSDRFIDMGNNGVYFDNISEFQLYGHYADNTFNSGDSGFILQNLVEDGDEVSTTFTGKSVVIPKNYYGDLYPKSFENASIFATLEDSNEYEFSLIYDSEDSEGYYYVNDNPALVGLEIISYRINVRNNVNAFFDLEDKGEHDQKGVLFIDNHGKVTKGDLTYIAKYSQPSGETLYYDSAIRATDGSLEFYSRNANSYGYSDKWATVFMGTNIPDYQTFQIGSDVSEEGFGSSFSGLSYLRDTGGDPENNGLYVSDRNGHGMRYNGIADDLADWQITHDNAIPNVKAVKRIVDAAAGYGFIGVYSDTYTLLSTDLTYRLTYFEYVNTIGNDFYLPNPADCLYKVITIVSPDGQSVKLHGTIAKGLDLTELDVKVSATLMAFNNNGTPKWVVLDHVEP